MFQMKYFICSLPLIATYRVHLTLLHQPNHVL